jgi:hypothetical protein
MRCSILAALPLALSLLITPAFAQSEEEVMSQIEALHGQSLEFGDFFGQVQDAFLFDNPSALADLAAYPLEVAANGEVYDVLEPQDFVDNFDALLSQDTLAGLSSQDFADLIVTSDGVGFANGAMWAANVCADDSCSTSDWLITRITN